MNPFLKIDQWYAAEQAVTNWCSSNNVECSVIRTGALDGGAFFNTQREFQAALEASLFDLENNAIKMSAIDNIDGKTGRDVFASAVAQALVRDVPVFSLISTKSGSLPCSVKNHMDLPVAGTRERVVYTPSDSEWDAAFAQL